MRNKLTFKDAEGNIILDVGLGIVAFSAIEEIKKAVLDIKENSGYEEIVSVFKTLSDNKANKVKFDDFGKGKSSLTEERDSSGPLDESDTPISAQVDDIKILVEYIEEKDFSLKEDSDNNSDSKFPKDEAANTENKDNNKKPFSAMNDAMKNVLKMDGSSFKSRKPKEEEDTIEKDDVDKEDDEDSKSEDNDDETESTKKGKIKDKVEDEIEDKEKKEI